MCSPIWRSSGASEAALNTINKCRSLAMRQSSGSCYVVPGNKSIIDGLCCVFGIPDTKISKAWLRRGCRMRFEVKRIVWIDDCWNQGVLFLHSLTWRLCMVIHGRRRL
jgi:hypothetical protein